MYDRRLSRRSALVAAVSIATTGVTLGRAGGDGLSVDVTNEGPPAVVDLTVERSATAVAEATATVEVPERGRERTSLSVPAGRYTVAVAVDGTAVAAVDLHLERGPTGGTVGPWVVVSLAADGSRTVTQA